MSRENSWLPAEFLKGMRQKDDLEDGKPPDFSLVVNETSAYLDAVVFIDWLKNNFILRDQENFCLS